MRYLKYLYLLIGLTNAVSLDNRRYGVERSQEKPGSTGSRTSGYKIMRADQAPSLKERTWNPPPNLKTVLDATWECKAL